MARRPELEPTSQPSELGGYAFYRQLGHEPLPNDYHDGNMGFHLPETLFDEDPSSAHKRIEDDLTQWGDVGVVRDEELFGGGVRRARRARLGQQDDGDSAANEWMKNNGFKW